MGCLQSSTTMKKRLLVGSSVSHRALQALLRVLRCTLERIQEQASGETFEGSLDWLIEHLLKRRRVDSKPVTPSSGDFGLKTTCFDGSKIVEEKCASGVDKPLR